MSDAQGHDAQARGGAEREMSRREELLLERALSGLSDRELLELGGAAESEQALEFELAAASVALALAGDQLQPTSKALNAKLHAGAKAYFAAAESAASTHVQRPPSFESTRANQPSAAPRSVLSNAGWVIAAAAAVIALVAWWPKPDPATGAELRNQLLAKADANRVEAKGQEPFAPGASGDIVWSNAEQAGFIRLVGAPVNDPKIQQYQLWIFDEAQEHPVDGGVFDVTASGEVLIPIDAKLRVTKPTLFAITLEKPGGVVVSDRQRIAIVAAL